jgi:predicted RNase H-like nuclease
MMGAFSIIGFDSAWTDNPKAPGAVCIIRFDADGHIVFVEPELANFRRALELIRIEQANAPRVLVALDQPTIVTNATGCRPVERVVSSYISWIGGGVQPSNRGRLGMFDDAAPIWAFKKVLSAIEDPELSRTTADGLFIMEVFPALALPGFFCGFSTRLGGPRYNPVRRKTFKIDDWSRVASVLSELGRQHQIEGLARWCRDHAGKAVPSKADQDRLDAVKGARSLFLKGMNDPLEELICIDIWYSAGVELVKSREFSTFESLIPEAAAAKQQNGTAAARRCGNLGLDTER